MSNSGYKKCFNSECVDFKSRKGWRLRSGDFADLCDRCASAYEEGRFCDMFHSNATGWRCCETCGKRLHCGCIVSVHAFTLLDSGGVECMTCARKKIVLTTNSTWSSSLFCNTPSIERLKDLSIRSQSPLAGPGPVPWRQASTLFGSSISQSEVLSRTLYEGDRLINLNEKLSGPSSLEKGKFEDVTARLMNGKLKLGSLDVLENGFAGKNREEQRSWVMAKAQQTSCLREDSSAPNFGMVLYPSMIETNSRSGGTPLAKQIHGNLHNGVDASADTQIRNGKSRADSRGRNQLPRYSPRITDEELQQISGNSNSVITPLFEKMLSASDAGRIGRLVLPKKCAEAYFPPISQPEGLPLKVQDCKGKEWIFQFRFWPNNNSRMYVLEGVTPCIQNMQLQAGDTVTFSRLEPEGKLVMGFRKASTAPPSDQDKETTSKTGNSSSTNGEFETADPSPKYRVDKSGYIAKEVLEAKASTKRRKSSTLGSRNKRLRIENEDVLELKLTWEEAQGLLRPPDDTPNVVVIEGFEFEEYEDAPVLGKPTIFATDDQGEKVQWAQCEACSKWRKLPASALLASKWSCSGNSWDPERSSCSAAQELTAEQLEDLLPSGPKKKMKSAKQEPDDDEALEGLDTLANLAILGEDEELPASAQTTTKHPRHRPGCSCIVCIQPPSGKGPKHKPTCACNVCQSVRRRFKTMMMKREKKQSDKEAESTENKQQPPLPEASVHNDCGPSSDPEISSPKKITGECSNDDPNISRNKSSTSPFKGQIDLNLQPERDEEFSPNSESGAIMNMSLVADDRGEQQKYLSSDGNNNLTGNQILVGREGTENKIVDGIGFGGGHHDADKDHTVTFSTIASTDAPATG